MVVELARKPSCSAHPHRRVTSLPGGRCSPQYEFGHDTQHKSAPPQFEAGFKQTAHLWWPQWSSLSPRGLAAAPGTALTQSMCRTLGQRGHCNSGLSAMAAFPFFPVPFRLLCEGSLRTGPPPQHTQLERYSHGLPWQLSLSTCVPPSNSVRMVLTPKLDTTCETSVR